MALGEDILGPYQRWISFSAHSAFLLIPEEVLIPRALHAKLHLRVCFLGNPAYTVSSKNRDLEHQVCIIWVTILFLCLCWTF